MKTILKVKILGKPIIYKNVITYILLLNIILIFDLKSQTLKINPADKIESSYSLEDLIKKKFISANSCVEISNIRYSQNRAGKTNPNLRSWAYFSNDNSKFEIKEGILLTSGYAKLMEGPNKHNLHSDGDITIWNGDEDLRKISKSTYRSVNASTIEFDFKSYFSEEISFKYIFASEEYNNRFECSTRSCVGLRGLFNDVFGFMISGPGITNDPSLTFKNIALIPGTNEPITIQNVKNFFGNHFSCGAIRCSKNSKYYISNGLPSSISFPFLTSLLSPDQQKLAREASTEFNGRTVVLTAKSRVNLNQTYHMKIGVSDIADNLADSGVFLASNSFKGYDIEFDKDEYSICDGGSVTINIKNTKPGIIYEWSDGKIGASNTIKKTGKFTVTAKRFGVTCNVKSKEINVVKTLPNFDLGEDVSICEGGSYEIDPEINTANVNYRWSDGSTGKTLKVNKAGTYYLKLTNAVCSKIDSINITIQSKPTINIPKKISICLSKLDKLSPITAPDGMNDYLWSTGEKTKSIIPNKSGTYWLQVRKGECVVRDSFKMEVSLGPKIKVETKANKIIATVRDGSKPYKFSIDGGKTYQNSRIFNNLDGGTYKVTVKDNIGCSSSSNIINFIDLIFPKFFSPNGDGVNDKWEIDRISNYKNVMVEIFDRYGKVLAKYNPKQVAWDGTYNNEFLKEDDYWYILTIENNMIFKGNFSLIR